MQPGWATARQTQEARGYVRPFARIRGQWEGGPQRQHLERQVHRAGRQKHASPGYVQRSRVSAITARRRNATTEDRARLRTKKNP